MSAPSNSLPGDLPAVVPPADPEGAGYATTPTDSEAKPSPEPRPTLFQRLVVFARSCLVGLAATASDLGTLCLLVYVFGVPDRIANIPSLLPGLVVMFLGNKFFAFEDKSRAILRQGGMFLAIEAAAFGLNALFYELIRVHFDPHPVLARLLGTCLVYLGFSFPLWSLLVFRQGRKPTEG